MSQTMDHIEYLSKEIGPRPAGTEEEQQAALYITEQFQKEAGFTAAMEEFSSSSNAEAGLAVLAGVAVAATVLAMIFPVLSIPAFILAAAAAVVYGLESFDRPVLSRVLSNGASQNVVAKYQPFDDEADAQPKRARTRKIILVAHYDTGRVTPSLVSRVESLGLPVPLACVVAMIAAAFFLLIRIFIASGGGMGLLILNLLSIIAVLVCLLPIVKALLVRSAPYNEGATNNATGTAALLEIARRISRGSVSEAELAEDADGVVIHGEAAAREAGLVPEGAQIRYDAEQIAPPSELGDYSEEERLLSAKAAIEALTGKPLERRVFGSVADNLVNSHVDESAGEVDALDEIMSPVAESFTGATSVTGAPAHDFSEVPNVSTSTAPSPAGNAEGFENAPSWFVAAQQNARKGERYNADEVPQVKRSRYTEAIESAERGFADREEELRSIEQARREEAARRALELQSVPEVTSPESEGVPQAQPGDAAERPLQLESQAGAEAEGAGESPASSPASDAAPVRQNPGGTIAMQAQIPASEIRAEAEAEAEGRGAEPGAAAAQALSGLPTPAAEADSPSEPSAHERIAKLPSIDPSNPYNPAPTTNPSRSGIMRKLRTNIPSLSGLISPVSPEPAAKDANAGQQSAGQRASSAQVTPAGDSQNHASHDPSLVEVPRSRSGNLLNRLRKNDDNDLSDTPQQWLDVDDDFEARSVGRARGSWESFRDDQYDDEAGFDQPGANGDSLSRRRWQGGAFSRVQLGHVETRSGEEDAADEFGAPAVPETVDPSLTGEIEQIYHFRNPQFNTEIWFVAMGSDDSGHGGARAFVEEHRSELRGSMIIEIESLGAGVLSVAKDEGRVRKVEASSRVRRYTNKATAETGIAVDSVSLAGTDSIASTLQKAGFQTMHLFGAEDGRPALKGNADDVLENVDEHALGEHIGFVYELLKG